MIDYLPLLNLKLGGNCLINGNISVFQKVINLYISCKLDPWPRNLNADFTLVNCLFGAEFNWNAHCDKYGYSGYSIEFNARSQFLLPDGSWGKNIIIFGVDNSSSVNVDNRKKNVLVLSKGSTQRSDDTAVTTNIQLILQIQKNIFFVKSVL